jgi:hypothetical protein
MRKFRALMEPFWDLKISKYSNTRVSSEYFTSSVLPSLTSTAGRTSRVLLAYVILWINKASLVLYIHVARIIHHACSAPCHERLEVWKLYRAVEFVSVIEASKLVTIEAGSWSQID